MMLNIKNRKPALAGFRFFFPKRCFVTLVSALVIFLLWYSTRLVIAILPESGRQPMAFASFAGDTFAICLTHSVEKTEWKDYFRVDGANSLVLTHTEFASLGWGYPYSDSEGKLHSTKDGKFILEMNRPYENISLRISEQAMQRFVHGDQEHDLIALYGQGAALRLKAQYRYEYWLENILLCCDI